MGNNMIICNNQTTQKNKIIKLSKQIMSCVFIITCANSSASAMLSKFKPLGETVINLGTRYATQQAFQKQFSTNKTYQATMNKTYEITDAARVSPFKGFKPDSTHLSSFRNELNEHLKVTTEMGKQSERHSLYTNLEIGLLRVEARSTLHKIYNMPTDTQEKKDAFSVLIDVQKSELAFMDRGDLISAFKTSLSHKELPMGFIEMLFSTEIPQHINIGHDDISHIISAARKDADQIGDGTKRVTRNQQLNIIQSWALASPATQRSKEAGQNNTGC